MRESLENPLKTGHVICILEGSAEEVIIKRLFENNNLIFKNGDTYDGNSFIRKFSRTRQAKKFAREFLEMDYGERHVNILRVLDSKKEEFSLGKVYEIDLKIKFTIKNNENKKTSKWVSFTFGTCY